MEGQIPGIGGRTEDEGDALPGFRPLYAQVQEVMVQRLINGTWPPGMTLPSEQKLAVELSVSQGTVRKALDAMTADNLLVRRQGRGTFVAEPEDHRMLFQFYKLTPDDGSKRAFPQSTIVSRVRSKPNKEQQSVLELRASDDVWRILRTRHLNGKPILRETLVLPAKRFENLGDMETIPNNVYELYSREFGITISRVIEKIRAVAAIAADCDALGCDIGAPLLQIDRRALALDGQVVEWRLSRAISENIHYLSELK